MKTRSLEECEKLTRDGKVPDPQLLAKAIHELFVIVKEHADRNRAMDLG